MSPKQAMQLRISLFRMELSHVWNTVVDRFAPTEHPYDRSMGPYDRESRDISRKDQQWHVALGIVGYTLAAAVVVVTLLLIYFAISGT